MPICGSPNGARHPRPQAGRDRPEWVVAINRNAWSQSIGTAGRDHPVRAVSPVAGISRLRSSPTGWQTRPVRRDSPLIPEIERSFRRPGARIPPDQGRIQAVFRTSRS